MAFPTKTNTGQSGSKKLAAFKKKAAERASPGESPSQYRARVEAQKAPATTVSPTTSQQIVSQLMPGVTQRNLAMEFVQSQKPATQAQITNLFPGITKRDLIKESLAAPKFKVPAKLTPSEINKIRSIQNQLPNFAGLPMSANMVAALRTDLNYRNQRINNRETYLNSLSKQASLELTRLNTYNPLIKNGVFIGTDAQYKEYQKQFDTYENAANNYNRNVEAHNLDVGEYNKNLGNLKKKTSPAAPIAKTLAAYTAAKKAVSKRLPSPEQAEPYIKKILQAAPGPSAYKILNATPQTRKYAEQIVKLNVGQYESFQKNPFKAGAVFATFFIGGAAIKAIGPAAKVLGFGARSTKAANLIGKGVAGVYVLQSGKRVMLVEDARQLGYVIGDIIFNEVLPAGLGLKFGIKVVSNLPKGAKLLKGTGTRVKTGLKEFAKAETAEVKFKKPTKSQFEAEFNRLYNKAVKESKIKANRELTKTELNNIKQSIRKNKLKEIESLSKKATKDRIRQEDTLAKQISNQFQKERVQKAKVSFEQKSSTLKGAAKEPTITNISKQTENLIKKAIRLQEKFDRGQISKTTYSKQKSDILKMAKEIEDLKKYAIELGVKPTTAESPTAINSAMSKTKSITAAKQNTIVSKAKSKNIVISPASALGAVAIPQSLINAISKAITQKKPLPYAKIRAFENTTLAPSAISKISTGTKTPTKTPIKKIPVKRPSKKTTRKPTAKIIAKTKPPKIIPPKTPTKKTTKKKKLTPAQKRALLAKQKNINAVATFKDLIG